MCSEHHGLVEDSPQLHLNINSRIAELGRFLENIWDCRLGD